MPLREVVDVVDYVANGSFASLKANVAYRDVPDYAILVRLVDFNSAWQGERVYVDEHAFRFLRKSSLEPGDVLVANVGANAGTVFRVSDLGQPMTLGPNAVALKPRDSSTLDRRFLYYFLCGPLGQQAIASIIAGSAQPKFNKTDLRTIPLPVPPMHIQERIADTLSVLDDKIELNRRMNHTLESIARAIFKSWFVDFDPVRKKMEGKTGGELGLPPSLAALFPDSLEDSPIGEIPRGWPAVPLSELVEVNPKYALRQAAEATYVEMANLPTDAARVTDTRPRPFQSGSRFKNGDVLVARITPCLENGKTALVDFLSPGETGWGSTEFLVLRRRPPMSPEYVYCLSRSDAFRDYAVGSMNGSSGRQRVPAEALEKFPTVRPNPEILTAFSRMAHNAVRQMAASDSESQNLRDLRDALLPVLLSGSVGARP